MDLENYLGSERLETLFDMILAIILIVLFMQLPQPDKVSLNELIGLKHVFITFFISFLSCISLWMHHHNLFGKIDNIDNTGILINLGLLVLILIIPYLTRYVSTHFDMLVPQVIYGLYFLVMDILFLLLTRQLMKINQKNIADDSYIVKQSVIVSVIIIIGIIIGYIGYPHIISYTCLLSIIIWFKI